MDDQSLKSVIKFDNIPDLLLAILQVAQVIAVPVTIYFIIYSGFLYVTARGNVVQISKATRSLTYSIVGGVIIIGSVAIGEIVKNLVNSF